MFECFFCQCTMTNLSSSCSSCGFCFVDTKSWKIVMMDITLFCFIIFHCVDKLDVGWSSQCQRRHNLRISSSKQSRSMQTIKQSYVCKQWSNHGLVSSISPDSLNQCPRSHHISYIRKPNRSKHGTPRVIRVRCIDKTFELSQER